MRDTITTGAAAGAAATLVVVGIGKGLEAAGLIQDLIFPFMERLVLPPNHGMPPWLLTVNVFLIAFLASAFFGVVLAYIYRITGRDHWLLKAAGYAGFCISSMSPSIPSYGSPGCCPCSGCRQQPWYGNSPRSLSGAF